MPDACAHTHEPWVEHGGLECGEGSRTLRSAAALRPDRAQRPRVGLAMSWLLRGEPRPERLGVKPLHTGVRRSAGGGEGECVILISTYDAIAVLYHTPGKVSVYFIVGMCAKCVQCIVY